MREVNLWVSGCAVGKLVISGGAGSKQLVCICKRQVACTWKRRQVAATWKGRRQNSGYHHVQSVNNGCLNVLERSCLCLEMQDVRSGLMEMLKGI